jgi:hypothetical protein
MEYKYYVVYTCNYHSTHNTIGAVEITTDIEMNTIESINNVRKYITENYLDGYGCVIVNFIELRNGAIGI